MESVCDRGEDFDLIAVTAGLTENVNCSGVAGFYCAQEQGDNNEKTHRQVLPRLAWFFSPHVVFPQSEK